MQENRANKVFQQLCCQRKLKFGKSNNPACEKLKTSLLSGFY